MSDVSVFAGTGNPALAAAAVAELGLALSPCTVSRFPDGELSVELEVSVRGHDVFLVQPTAPPVNDNLMELLVLADAARRASAARITAVIPYFGYARSDKRSGRRGPVTASAVARMLEGAGVAHVVTVEVHTPQLEGFFHVPIDDLSAVGTLCAELRSRVSSDAVVVSPDLGGARRASEYSQRLGLPTAVCRKRRTSGTEVSVSEVIGAVAGRPCIIVDDMITTGGTVAECARALREAGARPEPLVAATHGVFAPGARERLAAAGARAVLVTDTIAQAPASGVEVVSVAPLLGAALRRLVSEASLSDLV